MPSPVQIVALHKAVPAAQASFRKWGVPASVTLAQWIAESNWGQSRLATMCRNYFGIKATHLAAPETYAEFPAPEYENGQRVIVEALFAKYPDDLGSFDDHGRLLATAARYKLAMFHVNDPFAFAMALRNAGYSTTPDYGAQLAGFIRGHDLTQFDR